MRRWTIWMILLGWIVLQPGTVTGEALRLVVVDTQPFPGEQITLDAPVTLLFDRAINCAAAQAAIRLTPALAGEITCAADASSLTFIPTETYQRGTTYTLTVATDPLGRDGAALEAPFTLTFMTIGFLRVTEMLPAPDTENVAVDSVITVLFDRPVVPLLTSVDMAVLPHPLTITPAVDGVGSWLNTSTYIFRPSHTLLPHVTYTVTLDDGLTGADGALLAEPMTWSFQTTQPKVLRVEPADGARDLLLQPRQTIYFNMPVDRAMLEAHLYLRPSHETEATLPLTFEWGDDSTYVHIRPSERLKLATRYRVGLDKAGLLDASYPFAGLTNWSFTTVPPPSIVELMPEDGTQGVTRGNFKIRFTSPMDEESLRGKFTVDPVPDSVWEYYRYNEYVVSFSALPETEYTITSAGGFKDLYGNPVADDIFTVTYTTAPAPPSATLHTPYIGFHDAYRDDTGFYMTARNVEQVDFALYNIPVKKFVDALLDREGYLKLTDFDPTAHLRSQWSLAPADQSGQHLPYYISLSQGQGVLPPGIYFFKMEVTRPEPEHTPITNAHFAMVQTANLTVKSTLNQVMVWATDVQTGLPIPDARVQLYQRDEGLIAAGRTDADGLLVLDTPSVSNIVDHPRVAVLETVDHFGIGTSYWSNGIDPGHFNTFANYWREDYRFHLYIDRPVYRPAQKVYFRAVLRTVDDMRYSRPAFNSVLVRVQSSRGETIFERTLPLTDFGTVSGEFELDTSASLGYYSISIISPDSNEHSSGRGYQRFLVAEYRLPEFRVSVSPQRTDVVQGEITQTLVEGGYFSGGAVSDGRVRYNVISSPYQFFYTGSEKRYSFYDPWPHQDNSLYDDPEDRYTQTVAQGQAVTDASGQALIEIPAQLPKSGRSRVYTIEAVVSDQTDQAVANRADIVVHASAIYLGARVEKYVVSAGEPVDFGLLAVDWDSLPISAQPVTVEIIQRRWYSVQEMDAQGRTAWKWEIEDITVTESDVMTAEDGTASFSFTPERGGLYLARITTRDQWGHLSRAGASVWVSDTQYVAWPRSNNHRIELIADQDEYQVGETAAVLITSPFQGEAEALITIERGGWLHVERVTLTSSAYLYEFPILPDYAPNVFINVMIVKGVDETNPVADFRMGLLQVKVDVSQKVIHLDIQADRERAQPGDTIQYTVTATDHAGQPVQAELGVALTDLASLSVAAVDSSTLLETFYRLRGIGVRTATPLTINTDQITQNILEMVKGGGGGAVNVELREQFVDTPYWNAALVTNAAGIATFEVTLPDNLTTWRLDVRAVTSGDDGLMLVGEQTADLLSTLPLIVRPVTPRFFVVDDALTLAAVINNNTDEVLTVDVTLETEGLNLLHNVRPVQRITALANERVRVEWPVRVGDVETVEIIVSARDTSGRFADAARPLTGREADRRLPVYRYEVPETVATAGSLRAAGARTEAVLLPRRFNVREGELTLNVQPSLAATTLDGLSYLRAFPHECIEQTISRFLPNIMTYRALVNLELDDADLASALNQSTMRSLQRLNAWQRLDGGWGWFYTDHSNPLTTAYALIGLHEARKQGFPVSEERMTRALDYLQTQHIIPGLHMDVWRMNREAFILYALARTGQPDVARAANLFEYYELLNLDARAYLLMTLHLNDPDDTRIATLTADLISRAVVSATGTHWEEQGRDYWNWTTSTRTTALVLSALLMTRPDSELLPDVVRWLVFKREKTAWATTQETAWAVMALTDWMVITGELQPGYTFNIALNGERLARQAVTPADVRETYRLSVQVGDLLADEVNRLVVVRDAGDGALYYTSYLRLSLPVPEVEPLARGVVVDRRYMRVDGDQLTEINEAKVGDIVQVRLTLVAPNGLHYLMINDPLPAGAEAIDPNLNIGQRIGISPGYESRNPFVRGWNWWWFSYAEFRDAQINLYATYLPAGTYEYVYYIRAGIPGVYNVIPPTAQEFYFPEVYGRGAGSLFTIQPAAQ